MVIKKLFIIVFSFFLLISITNTEEIKIITKVGDEIITNLDIRNEKNYLLLLNTNLNKLTEKEILNLSKKSLIREKIKEREINKFFNKKMDAKIEKKIIENFYKRLGFSNQIELTNVLNQKNLNLQDLKKKLLIEAKWNQLIYTKYNSKIKINVKTIEQDIKNNFDKQEKQYDYNLSEILVDLKNYNNSKKKELIKYIKNFGFEIAANKFSKSDTSNYGGEIGWIKSTRLSKKIKNKIEQIEIGEITDEIQTPNGYLILKLNNKRIVKEKLNLEKELKQQINFERNRQLNQFSLNYYKKLKQNSNIYENK
tara:strand:- start:2226 stop:3155 length:930 start_codon:yes stop_codon:yes gene_type:complete